MARLSIDPRIVQILECALNAKHRYTSVSVTFSGGEQKVDSLYTAPSYGTGTHFLDNGRHKASTLDDVLAIARSFEDKGDVKTLIKNVEERKREALKLINENKKYAKDLDITLSSLLNLEEME